MSRSVMRTPVWPARYNHSRLSFGVGEIMSRDDILSLLSMVARRAGRQNKGLAISALFQRIIHDPLQETYLFLTELVFCPHPSLTRPSRDQPFLHVSTPCAVTPSPAARAFYHYAPSFVPSPFENSPVRSAQTSVTLLCTRCAVEGFNGRYSADSRTRSLLSGSLDIDSKWNLVVSVDEHLWVSSAATVCRML